MSVFDHVFIKFNTKTEKIHYHVHKQYKYFSLRYGKWVHCNVGMKSDGATGAWDINSFGWLVHDKLCKTAVFEDGSPCTNWQASMILSDILKSEGRWVRAQTWKYSTFVFGGEEIKKANGWW